MANESDAEFFTINGPEIMGSCYGESEKALRNRDLRDDVKLVQLYKLFSPPHLLKESFATDANSLDRDFYL